MGTASSGPRVKALDWRVAEENGAVTHVADTLLGPYAAWEKGGGAILMRTDGSREAHARVEDAKAAAQADFTSRILGALDLG